jgi:GNAT superfamily N-acetyltransferase
MPEDHGYSFRRSEAEDIAEALRLRAKLFAEMGVENDSLLDNAEDVLLKIYKDAYAADEIVHYFASSGGEIVAVAGALLKRDFPYLTFKPGYYGWIIDVYTAPGHRGKGLASRLMALTHEWLVLRGAHEAKLISAGAGPRRLYEKLGYRSTWEMSYNLSGKRTYNELIDAHSAASSN